MKVIHLKNTNTIGFFLLFCLEKKASYWLVKFKRASFATDLLFRFVCGLFASVSHFVVQLIKYILIFFGRESIEFDFWAIKTNLSWEMEEENKLHTHTRIPWLFCVYKQIVKKKPHVEKRWNNGNNSCRSDGKEPKEVISIFKWVDNKLNNQMFHLEIFALCLVYLFIYFGNFQIITFSVCLKMSTSARFIRLIDITNFMCIFGTTNHLTIWRNLDKKKIQQSPQTDITVLFYTHIF